MKSHDHAVPAAHGAVRAEQDEGQAEGRRGAIGDAAPVEFARRHLEGQPEAREGEQQDQESRPGESFAAGQGADDGDHDRIGVEDQDDEADRNEIDGGEKAQALHRDHQAVEGGHGPGAPGQGHGPAGGQQE